MLRLVQVIYPNARYGCQAKQFSGFQPRIPVDYDIVFADEERNVESQRANRIRYFTNVRWNRICAAFARTISRRQRGRARSEAKEECRFGGAWLLFPLPPALPAGVNAAPSLSNLCAGCAARHPYSPCSDPGISVSGSSAFFSRASLDNRRASCLVILSESCLRNS